MSNILAPTQAEVKARLHYDETTGVNRWQAVLRRNGKNFYLGSYETKQEAYAVYCNAIVRIDGEFARAA